MVSPTLQTWQFLNVFSHSHVSPRELLIGAPRQEKQVDAPTQKQKSLANFTTAHFGLMGGLSP